MNNWFICWFFTHIFTGILVFKGLTARRGPGSSVGIATGYGLDVPGIESLLGRDFFAPVQTGPGAHPASCTMGTGFFPGGKAAGALC
jgi:hypothetical protein